MALLTSSSDCEYAQLSIADSANLDERALVSMVCALPHELALLARVVPGLMAERVCLYNPWASFCFSDANTDYFMRATTIALNLDNARGFPVSAPLKLIEKKKK